MKGIDTNVLIRYLVRDNAVQWAKASHFIRSNASKNKEILIGDIVLCETVWVLDSVYGYPKLDICEALEKILQTATFTFQNKDLIRAALEEYRQSKADFADCLMGRVHKAAGCETTVTFDNNLKNLATFTIL